MNRKNREFSILLITNSTKYNHRINMNWLKACYQVVHMLREFSGLALIMKGKIISKKERMKLLNGVKTGALS